MMIWTWHGEEVDPTPEMIRACIDGVFAEANREERPLTPDEKEDVADLYALLDSLAG